MARLSQHLESSSSFLVLDQVARQIHFFGFGTALISGAEKAIEKLWQLSPVMHGLVMGSALWGTVLGALVGAWPTDRLGLKPALFWVGILNFVSID